jgi:hypothetical protein
MLRITSTCAESRLFCAADRDHPACSCGRVAIRSVVKNAPVLVPVGEDMFTIGGATLRAETQARLWDYGVVSFSFRIPIEPGTTWGSLVSLAAASESSRAFHETARARSHELMSQVRGAARGIHDWQQIEDYTIFFLERVAGISHAAQLIEKADVPALVLAEPVETLADGQRKPVLDAAIQYATNDLAVIDWNSAVLVEPSASRDVADVIEFALTHLVEFRYYDELLDARLGALYNRVAQRRTSILRSDYRRLSRESGALFMELSEFTERVDNSLKFVGDFYLATVFRTAVKRFRLTDWEQNVSRKIQLLGRVSDLINNEVNSRRSQLLEIIVVLLILFEVIWAVIYH